MAVSLFLLASFNSEAQKSFGLYASTGNYFRNTPASFSDLTVFESSNQLGVFKQIGTNLQLELGGNFIYKSMKEKSNTRNTEAIAKYIGLHVGVRKIVPFNRFFVSSLNQLSYLKGEDLSETTRPST